MTTAPQLTLTRVVNASRSRVYKAFTDPDDFSRWWGPFGNSIPRDEMTVDLRPGGSVTWSEYFPEDPDTWTHGRIDFTDVVEGELLDGIMRITGNLPGDHEPFETRMRVEFFDETEGKTRLEVRQWLPATHVSGTKGGWGEAFVKLETMLAD